MNNMTTSICTTWRMNESHNQTAGNPTPCHNPGSLFRPFIHPHPLHISHLIYFSSIGISFRTQDKYLTVIRMRRKNTRHLPTPRACAHAHLLGLWRWWGCGGCRLKVFYKWGMKFGLREMDDLEYYRQQTSKESLIKIILSITKVTSTIFWCK